MTGQLHLFVTAPVTCDACPLSDPDLDCDPSVCGILDLVIDLTPRG